MGVPRLFPWLIKAFPKAVVHFQEGKYSIHVDGLYIDANGLLHQAAQIEFNYGDVKRKMDPNAHLTYDEKIIKVYTRFFNMIKDVAKIVIPTKTLYIAIDGPAPIAKQAQQRFRRFQSAAAATTPGSFDPNCITPGTIFMFELTKYMHFAIRKEMSATNTTLGGSWRNIQVYFSPPTVPGEGEHKIMDYMRTIPNAKDLTHCMFGPDGDLIMLTLAAHLPKMFLFRADQYNPGFYDLLDMGIVSSGLAKTLNQTKREANDVVNDFILAGFFVGNDFLPKIQMFMYLEDGLNLILSLYNKLSKGGTVNKLTAMDNISFPGLTELVKNMAGREKWYLQDQAKAKPTDPRFIDTTLLKNVKDEKLDFVSFRKDYYAKSNITDSGTLGNPSAEVREMCVLYVIAINWVFLYYVVGITSWVSYYPRYYAPLMTDLAVVLDTLTAEEINRMYPTTIDEPSLPFVQLLSVIAPKNADLLPKPYSELMTSLHSPLVKAGYYPTSFKIDYEGKTKEHMGISLLPFIDVALVRKCYNEVNHKQVKYTRNTFGHLELFTVDPKYTADYTSDYGTLKNMHIRKKIIT